MECYKKRKHIQVRYKIWQLPPYIINYLLIGIVSCLFEYLKKKPTIDEKH